MTGTREACSDGGGGDGGDGGGVIIGHVQDFSFLNEERRQEGKPAKPTQKPAMKFDESVEAATVVVKALALMQQQRPRTLTPRGWSEPARS
ncbi:hypothetical protein Aduo_001216 [Ancylostoma duodenale]